MEMELASTTEAGAEMGMEGATIIGGGAEIGTEAGPTTGATAGVRAVAAIVAGLATFLYFSLGRWTEGGEEASPAAAALCFLVG
jgi:hypothetical protein